MANEHSFEIEGGASKAFHVTAGSTIRLTNIFGAQVVGVWAFVPPDMNEHMSMEHTRIHSKSSRPQPGTVFYTNRHNPILEFVEDRSPGIHDWFLAACNQQRYENLGHDGPHASCEDNLFSAMQHLGHPVSYVPCSLNLFENVSLLFGAAMEIKPPVAMPGDFVCLKVLQDCVIAMSSCPQDILLTNGPDRIPRSIEVDVMV